MKPKIGKIVSIKIGDIAVKPPLGVMPWHLWHEANPDPSVRELADRFEAVLAAIGRYRDAGLRPMAIWLLELGQAPTKWLPNEFSFQPLPADTNAIDISSMIGETFTIKGTWGGHD